MSSPTIAPAITASTAEEYRTQIERVASCAVRLHIDMSDGMLTPNKLIDIDQVWWPGGVQADLHVMYKKPFEHLPLMIDLRPQLIIVHAEAEGDFMAFAKQAHQHGIEVGVALQAETPVDLIRPALNVIDHVLIFSGKLGYFGGKADLSLLEKARQLRALKPQLELGWDGGVNTENARALAEGGINVLNSGGFIQKADDASKAYDALVAAVS